jgi:type IV pilus assembly protein PilA
MADMTGGEIMKDRIRLARRAHTDDVEIEGTDAAEAGFTLIELMVVLLIIAILLAIAIPTFLGVTNTAGDRSAQSNLTNAVTEAKALYQVTGAYATAGGTPVVYTNTNFASQAPEFTWQTAACTATSPGNCISFAVVDSSASADSQGVALAAWSTKTNTCWYALDLETTPKAIATDASSIMQGGNTTALSTAGVFYGKSTTTTSCAASNVIAPAAAAWGANYGAAGVVG